MGAVALSLSRKAELVFNTKAHGLTARLRLKGNKEGNKEVLRPCLVLQDIGELCLKSVHCKSGCCHRDSGLSLARCAPKAAESQECSPRHISGIYYKCPCERGLSCHANKTIVGSITNRNFGVCKDPQDF
ncbi:hypothetical protein DV515_00012274 [Chloebia gouldiae]|uniref:Colipase n=1 Tax=Chloebia gouldiae TaxID=44316 RepID=A0A3L8S3Y1_CHLGU|nr:hypothetical protein DV515_00012274 [Chloebia gouldiae]